MRSRLLGPARSSCAVRSAILCKQRQGGLLWKAVNVKAFSPYVPILGARKDTFLLSSTAPVDDTSTAFLAVVACHCLDGAATAMAAVADDDTGPSLSVSVGQQPQWQQWRLMHL